jgi:hypothetical protein
VVGPGREIGSEDPLIRLRIVDLRRVGSAAQAADGVDLSIELSGRELLPRLIHRREIHPSPGRALRDGGTGVEHQKRENRNRIIASRVTLARIAPPDGPSPEIVERLRIDGRKWM